MAFGVFFDLDDAGFDHFVVQIVAFAGSFTHPGKHRNTAMQLRDVINELHDDHGLAYASPTEGTDFTTLEEGTDQINHLDTGGQNLR